jgi:aminodeoxyfutalosine synthase
VLYGHVEQTPKKSTFRNCANCRTKRLARFSNLYSAFVASRKNRDGTYARATGVEDLREIAVARLMLDNFPHIKSFWIMNSAPSRKARYGLAPTTWTAPSWNTKSCAIRARPQSRF